MKSMNVKHTDDFNTPDHIFEQLNSVFNFTLDAACDSTNAKCDKAFRIDLGVDGITESWRGERVFCNPPFSQKRDWIEKAKLEVEHNGCPVCVMILPLNCMSTNFFYDLVIKGGYKYQIPKGRIQFLNNYDKTVAKGNNSGTVIVYFMQDIEVQISR